MNGGEKFNPNCSIIRAIPFRHYGGHCCVLYVFFIHIFKRLNNYKCPLSGRTEQNIIIHHKKNFNDIKI